MKRLILFGKVLFVIASVVLMVYPVLGYQLQEELPYIPGIEERPGTHSVHGLALSPDEQRLYAAHWQSGTVQVNDPIGVYSTDNHNLIEKLGVGGCVGGVIVSDDGCCVYGTRYYGGEVHSFDVCNENTEAILELDHGWAHMLWKSPDGTRAIVAYNSSSPFSAHHLALLDISGDNCSMSIMDTLNLGRPGSDRSVAFLPDGSMMYTTVGSSSTEGVVLLEVSLNGSIAVNRSSAVLAGGPSQEHLMAGVVLVGDTLYVGDEYNMKIHMLDRLSLIKTGEIDLSPHSPRNIALHPDGQHLFILSGTDCGRISVFDLQTQTDITQIN